MSIHFTVGMRPDRSIDEIYKHGVKTLYCGYIEQSAIEKWPEAFLTLNKRGEDASFYGKQNFKNFAVKANKYDISVFVTFNGAYTPEQYEWILNAIKTVSSYEAVKGIIVNDMGLLLRLQQCKYKKEIVMSTEGTTFNSATVSFYKKFGIKRIVLDRQLKINEIKDIIKYHDDIKFEIFLLFANCLFVDGFCSLLHCHEASNKNKKTYFDTNGKLSNCSIIYQAQNEHNYKVINKSRKHYDFAYRTDIKNGEAGCNLCAIKELVQFSDRLNYKIVSRGNIFVNEFDIIQPFLSAVYDLDKNTINQKDFFKKIFQIDCNGYGCYASKKII